MYILGILDLFLFSLLNITLLSIYVRYCSEWKIELIFPSAGDFHLGMGPCEISSIQAATSSPGIVTMPVSFRQLHCWDFMGTASLSCQDDTIWMSIEVHGLRFWRADRSLRYKAIPSYGVRDVSAGGMSFQHGKRHKIVVDRFRGQNIPEKREM